jgi:hypothetical protein
MRGPAVFMVATAVVGIFIGSPSPAFGQTTAPATDAPPDVTTAAPPFPVAPPVVEPLPAAAIPSPATALPSAPQMYHRPFGPLVTAGEATFYTSYMLAVVTGVLVAITGGGIDGPPCSCNSQIALWAVPVLGPVLGDAYGSSGNRITWPFAVWSGVEAAGAAMMIVGFIGHDVPVETFTPPPRVTVVPTVKRQLSALSLNFNW